MTTIADILSEGDFFGSHWRDVVRIDGWIRSGLVTVERVELLTRDRVSMSADEARHVETTFSGRTFRHQQLCHQVSMWMDACGVPWSALSERLAYEGGIADVAASDGSLFVECGYTSARKITAAMLRGRTVMVVPYLDGPCLGFIFRAVDSVALGVAYENETHEAEKMRDALERHGSNGNGT